MHAKYVVERSRERVVLPEDRHHVARYSAEVPDARGERADEDSISGATGAWTELARGRELQNKVLQRDPRLLIRAS